MGEEVVMNHRHPLGTLVARALAAQVDLEGKFIKNGKP